VSDQRLQTRGGERWPGNEVASEMRCHRPAVQAASVPACLTHARALTAGTGWGLVRSPRPECLARSVEQSRCSLNGQTRMKGRPPGTSRSKPKKHRARDACGDGGLAALKTTRQASMSRGVEARGSVGPQAFRAPSVFPGGAKEMRFQKTARPGPQRTGAAERWLFDRHKASARRTR
jgi:hypothetical protein